MLGDALRHFFSTPLQKSPKNQSKWAIKGGFGISGKFHPKSWGVPSSGGMIFGGEISQNDGGTTTKRRGG